MASTTRGDSMLEQLEKKLNDLRQETIPEGLTRAEETIYLLKKRSDIIGLEQKIEREMRMEKVRKIRDGE